VTGARFLLAAGLLCGAAVLGVILDDGPPFEAKAAEPQIVYERSDGSRVCSCPGNMVSDSGYCPCLGDLIAGDVITYTSDGGATRNCIGCPDPTTGAGEVSPEHAGVVLIVKGSVYFANGSSLPNCADGSYVILDIAQNKMGCQSDVPSSHWFAATHHALAYLNEHQIPESQVVGLFGVRKIALTASVSKLETPQPPLVEERLTWRLER
jgi:hypothetical protein